MHAVVHQPNCWCMRHWAISCSLPLQVLAGWDPHLPGKAVGVPPCRCRGHDLLSDPANETAWPSTCRWFPSLKGWRSHSLRGWNPNHVHAQLFANKSETTTSTWNVQHIPTGSRHPSVVEPLKPHLPLLGARLDVPFPDFRGLAKHTGTPRAFPRLGTSYTYHPSIHGCMASWLSMALNNHTYRVVTISVRSPKRRPVSTSVTFLECAQCNLCGLKLISHGETDLSATSALGWT